jgi:hypothetical protein
MPELQKITGGLSGILGNVTQSGQLGADAAIKGAAQGQLNQGYDQAIRGSREAVGYGALRSGAGRLSPGATGSAITSAATSLDRDRQSALRNLEFQSAQSSMQDYNQVLQLLGQGSKSALSLSSGFAGASSGAIAGLSSQSQFGSTLGGFASGASLGSVAGVPGAIVGGVVGGLGGYLGSG